MNQALGTVRPGVAGNMLVRAGQVTTQPPHQPKNLLSQQPVMMRPPATVGGLSPNKARLPLGSPALQNREKRKYDQALKYVFLIVRKISLI